MGDGPGGIRLIRETFGNLLPQGYTVAQAFMDYKHEHDVEWQVLTFHVNTPDGKVIALTSDKVPARDNVNELAEKTARKFVERMKHEQAAAPPPAADGSEPKSE